MNTVLRSVSLWAVIVFGGAMIGDEAAGALRALFPEVGTKPKAFVKDAELSASGAEAGALQSVARVRELEELQGRTQARLKVEELTAAHTAQEVAELQRVSDGLTAASRSATREAGSLSARGSGSWALRPSLTKEIEQHAKRVKEKTATLQAERAVVDRTQADLKQVTARLEIVVAEAQTKVAQRPGLLIERDTVIVQFTRDTSVDRIRAVFARYQLEAELIDGDLKLFTTRLSASPSPNSVQTSVAVHRMVRILKAEPGVMTAYPNTTLSPKSVPSMTLTAALAGESRCWSYTNPCEENATSGLRSMMFPAAWNFRDAIVRYGEPEVRVGVLDVGFAAHSDLALNPVPGCSVSIRREENDHGNLVAGIIGASFGNGIGTDGACPFAKIFNCGVPTAPSGDQFGRVVAFDLAIQKLQKLIAVPGLRVVNASLGYNWREIFINPDSTPSIQEFVADQGVTMQSIAMFARERGKGIVFVTAAGNDSAAVEGGNFNNVSARFASPLNWAALSRSELMEPQPNVIVVESRSPTGTLSAFSNRGGSLSAPGEEVTGPGGETSAYHRDSGTSFAAPHVTALVALMFAYNPQLTADEVVQRLAITSPAGSVPAPMPNAFLAMIAARPAEAFKHLADLNDDGSVDMADFVIFKAALDAVESGVFAADLNGDGVADETDRIFPRADLNGSGSLSRYNDAVRIGTEVLSDLDILVKAWNDPTVPAAELPILIGRP